MRKFLGVIFPWLGIPIFAVVLGSYVYAKAPTHTVPSALETTTTSNVVMDESWYVIMFKDKRIGYSHNVKTPFEKGVSINDELNLKMHLMGQARDVNTVQSAILDAQGKVESFTFKMESSGATIFVKGRQKPGKLSLEVHSAGVTQNVDLPLKEPIIMSGNLGAELAATGFQKGKSFTRPFFDPAVMKPAPMLFVIEDKDTLKVGARTLDVFRVKQTFNGMETVTWFDAKGVVYKEESPSGFSSFRTTREDAMRVGEGATIDLIAATNIETENMPGDPRSVHKLVLNLNGVSLKGFDLDGDGQKLAGNQLTIDRTKPAPSSIDTANYLQPEPLMQVGDPAVKAAVAEATGGFQGAGEVSKRVLKWVYGNLEKASTVSLPSAVEVLRTRQGDCNEHAILYTAMVRTAGVPSRVASGVVALGDAFYYHAWSEIYLDGSWLAVDPVFGQYPADATHIRFVVGGLERQAELMRVIGKLKIKVISADP